MNECPNNQHSFNEPGGNCSICGISSITTTMTPTPDWENIIRNLPSDEGGLAIERMHPTDQDKLIVAISTLLSSLLAEETGKASVSGFNLGVKLELEEMEPAIRLAERERIIGIINEFLIMKQLPDGTWIQVTPKSLIN